MNTKHILAAAVAAIILPLSALAYTQVVNNIEWTYTIVFSDSGNKTFVGSDDYYGARAVPPLTSGAITIPGTLGGRSVTEIGTYAFSDLNRLTSVTIPGTVKVIGARAFNGCSGLTYVSIPGSVTTIGVHAFDCCYGLTSVTIPNSVKRIEDGAFNACRGLVTMTIPDSVTTIGNHAFDNCSGLTSFVVGANNPNYCSVNGLLLSKDGKSLIRGINGNVTIPNGVTNISDCAFSGCTNLMSVKIPASVTAIGSNAFKGCTALTSVTIPNSVKSIGFRAFCGCSGLTSVTIPDSVTSIGGSAFSGCNTSLFDTATMPGVKLVDGWAVGYESSLSGVLVLTGIRGISASAFDGCSNLTSVSIPGTVEVIPDTAFYDCDSLTSVSISNAVKSIGVQAFSSCGNLSSVTIPDSVTSIGGSAFSGCNTSLFDTATMPGVKLVDGWAVGYESSLSGVLDLTGVKGVGDSAFSGCGGITSVMVPESMGGVGYHAFASCANLETAYVPAPLKAMVEGNEAFYYCNKATVIYYRDTDWFVMTFDAGNGKGGTAFKCLVGTPLVAPIVTRANFTFEGWNPEVPPTVPAEDTTYVAQWTAKNYTITFNANGGTGGWMKRLGYGSALPAPTVKRTGYVFAGWSPAVPKTVPHGDATYTAKWTPTTYKVAFNANGGTLPKGKTMAAQKMTYGKAAALRKNVFTRSGYVFIGWAKSKTGAIAYKDAQSVKNLRADGKTVTLYAIWAKKTYKVAFYANGGTGKMAAQTMTYGKATKLTTNKFTAPKGKKFAGWATSAANAKKGAVKYKNKQSVKNLLTTGKTVKLYAVWVKR